MLSHKTLSPTLVFKCAVSFALNGNENTSKGEVNISKGIRLLRTSNFIHDPYITQLMNKRVVYIKFSPVC